MTKITTLPDLSYEILDLLTDRRLSNADICNELPESEESDIRYSIRRLQEHGVIQVSPNLMDMRSSKYRLSSSEELEESRKLLTDDLYNKVMTNVNSIESAAVHA